MKDPHEVILKPYITERAVSQSYGDPRIREEKNITHKYAFLVTPRANKLEIKEAIEAIYNAGKKKGDWIEVVSVNTATLHGKKKRVRTRTSQMPVSGYRSDRKKAIVTLKKGQIIEDYGV